MLYSGDHKETAILWFKVAFYLCWYVFPNQFHLLKKVAQYSSTLASNFGARASRDCLLHHARYWVWSVDLFMILFCSRCQVVGLFAICESCSFCDAICNICFPGSLRSCFHWQSFCDMFCHPRIRNGIPLDSDKSSQATHLVHELLNQTNDHTTEPVDCDEALTPTKFGCD